MSENTVIEIGNLTKDFTFSANGKAFGYSSIAVNRRWQQDGQWKESTSYFDVVVFGDLAINLQNSKGMGKGARVVVVGRFEQETKEVKGQKRSFVRLVAEEISPSLKWAKVSVAKLTKATATLEEAETLTNEEKLEAAATEGSDVEPF